MKHRDPPLDGLGFRCHDKKGHANLKLSPHTDGDSLFPSDEPKRGVLLSLSGTSLTAKCALSPRRRASQVIHVGRANRVTWYKMTSHRDRQRGLFTPKIVTWPPATLRSSAHAGLASVNHRHDQHECKKSNEAARQQEKNAPSSTYDDNKSLISKNSTPSHIRLGPRVNRENTCRDQLTPINTHVLQIWSIGQPRD